jgi:hypothetical protein
MAKIYKNIYIRTMYIYISEINLNYIQLYREEKIDFTKKKTNESNTCNNQSNPIEMYFFWITSDHIADIKSYPL